MQGIQSRSYRNSGPSKRLPQTLVQENQLKSYLRPKVARIITYRKRSESLDSRARMDQQGIYCKHTFLVAVRGKAVMVTDGKGSRPARKRPCRSAKYKKLQVSTTDEHTEPHAVWSPTTAFTKSIRFSGFRRSRRLEASSFSIRHKLIATINRPARSLFYVPKLYLKLKKESQAIYSFDHLGPLARTELAGPAMYTK